VPNHSKPKCLIIIGAGLSGLYAAYLLQDHFEIVILEANDHIGGRILGTLNGGDLGPTWVWSHHKATLALSQELGLTLFAQYTKGDALYDDPKGVQRFSPAPFAPSARFAGGVSTLTDALYNKLHRVKFHFNTPVDTILDQDDEIIVQSGINRYQGDKVISTLPPRLIAQNIRFSPPLSSQIVSELNQTPTWMAQSAKALISYESAFWREDGLSGFAISHQGILGEIHDASQADHPALFGFFHAHRSVEDSKSAIIDQFTRLFGPYAAHPLCIDLKDWKIDPCCSTPLDQIPLSDHPDYGLDISAFDGRFSCIGTETSYIEGGYLEGALQSALKISKQLLSI
jgi:monoamine oxidase